MKETEQNEQLQQAWDFVPQLVTHNHLADWYNEVATGKRAINTI